MKKITKSDIHGIKPGKEKAFVFDTASAVHSARSYAYQLSKRHDLPKGVAKYITIANYGNNTLIIIAQADGVEK